jgi:hypothetical protein
MTATLTPPLIAAVLSCPNVAADYAGAVIISGSSGGQYNAFNAENWGIEASS